HQDYEQPVTVVARFGAYAQTFKGDDGSIFLNHTWQTRGAEQLSKCAEALAFRMGWPEESAGLYITEELQNLEEREPEAKPPAAVTPPQRPEVPVVDHKPAEGTDEPRPGEEKKKRGRPRKKEGATVLPGQQPLPVESGISPDVDLI